MVPEWRWRVTNRWSKERSATPPAVRPTQTAVCPFSLTAGMNPEVAPGPRAPEATRGTGGPVGLGLGAGRGRVAGLAARVPGRAAEVVVLMAAPPQPARANDPSVASATVRPFMGVPHDPAWRWMMHRGGRPGAKRAVRNALRAPWTFRGNAQRRPEGCRSEEHAGVCAAQGASWMAPAGHAPGRPDHAGRSPAGSLSGAGHLGLAGGALPRLQAHDPGGLAGLPSGQPTIRLRALQPPRPVPGSAW